MKLPKTFGDWYLILIYLFIAAMLCFSCAKSGEYIQKPTCYHYLRITDYWYGELMPPDIPTRSDTIFPTPELPQYVCGNDTVKLLIPEQLNKCSTYVWKIRYILIK